MAQRQKRGPPWVQAGWVVGLAVHEFRGRRTLSHHLARPSGDRCPASQAAGPPRHHTDSSTGHVAFLHFCSHSFMHCPGEEAAWGPAGHCVPTGSGAGLGVRLASRLALSSQLLWGLRRRSPPRCSSPQEVPSFPPVAALPGGSLLASHGGSCGKGARGPARRLRGVSPLQRATSRTGWASPAQGRCWTSRPGRRHQAPPCGGRGTACRAP